MPRYEITSPEGKRYEITAPEGATQEQALSYFQQEFMPPASAAPELPQPSGFAQRMQDDFKQRQANARPTNAAYAKDEIGALQAGFQHLGQGAGLVGDLAGNVVGSAARYAGDLIPEAIKEPVKNAGVRVYNYASDSAVGDVARDYTRSYQDFAQENPNTDRNLAALLNIGGLGAGAAPIKGASAAAGTALKPVASAAKNTAIKSVEKLATPARVMPNSEQLAEMGVKAYDAARASGEVFDAGNVTNKFVSAIESAKPRKIAGTVETDLSQALEANLGKYKGLANKPLSIDEIDIIDKDLSNLKDQAYNAGKNQLGGQLSNIQNALRGSVEDAPSGQTLAQARDMFRRKYQMEDVERIFRNAEGRPNEAAIIQTGYRNLANQARKKGSGYSKEQIALMDKAAKGGLSIDALKFMSNKMIAAAVGATGGAAAGATAYMGNLAAGAGATALQTAKANKLAKSITKGITVEAEPTLVNRAAQRLLTPKEIAQLPPAEAKAYLQLTYRPNAKTYGTHPADLPVKETIINAGGPSKPLQLTAPERAIEVTPQGTARVQSQAARDAGIEARLKGAETGLTLDVRKAQEKLFNDRRWAALEDSQKTQVAKEIDLAYQQNKRPIMDIIEESLARAETEFNPPQGAIAQALKNRKTKFTKQDLVNEFEAKKKKGK